MNINYENFNPENISTEVKQWYAFPEDKTLINKFLNDELFYNKAERKQLLKQANWDSGVFVASTMVGIISFCYLMMPAGKVVRDIIDSKSSKFRYWSRRFVPFLGLAIPIVMTRKITNYSNGYRE